MIKSNVPLKFTPPDSIRYTCPANQNINLFYYVEFKPNWTVSLKCTWFCSMFWACTISGHICTTLDKFETTSSFLRLGLPSTLIRHGNGALWKRPINRWNLCWRKSWSHAELFRKRCSHDCHVVSLIKFLISDCCIFKFLLCSADGTAVSTIYFTEQSKRLFLLNIGRILPLCKGGRLWCREL